MGAADSELKQIEALERKLADMPDPDLELAETIKDRIIAWAKKFPRAAMEYGAAVKQKFLWVIKVCQKRKSLTAAEQALVEGNARVKRMVS